MRVLNFEQPMHRGTSLIPSVPGVLTTRSGQWAAEGGALGDHERRPVLCLCLAEEEAHCANMGLPVAPSSVTAGIPRSFENAPPLQD